MVAHRRPPGSVPFLSVMFLYHISVELHPICPSTDVLYGFIRDVSDGELARVRVERITVAVRTEVLWYSVRKLDWSDSDQMLDSVEQNSH